jgi:hypothetical protein
MPYTKDLTQITTLRLSPRLYDEAQDYASFLGISFSEFVRQSLAVNMASSSVNAEREKECRYPLIRISSE